MSEPIPSTLDECEYNPQVLVNIRNGTMNWILGLLLAVATGFAGYYYAFYQAEDIIRDKNAKKLEETMRKLQLPPMQIPLPRVERDREA